MIEQARLRLHNKAVDLWRASLTRDLTASERRQYHAIEEAMNPLLPAGFAEKYLKRGSYYATNAAWDAQLAEYKARPARQRSRSGRKR